MDRASKDTDPTYASSSVDDQGMPEEEAMHIALVLNEELLSDPPPWTSGSLGNVIVISKLFDFCGV
jgi:hypothetical protein